MTVLSKEIRKNVLKIINSHTNRRGLILIPFYNFSWEFHGSQSRVVMLVLGLPAISFIPCHSLALLGTCKGGDLSRLQFSGFSYEVASYIFSQIGGIGWHLEVGRRGKTKLFLPLLSVLSYEWEYLLMASGPTEQACHHFGLPDDPTSRL